MTDLGGHQCLKPEAGQGVEERAVNPHWVWGPWGLTAGRVVLAGSQLWPPSSLNFPQLCPLLCFLSDPGSLAPWLMPFPLASSQPLGSTHPSCSPSLWPSFLFLAWAGTLHPASDPTAPLSVTFRARHQPPASSVAQGLCWEQPGLGLLTPPLPSPPPALFCRRGAWRCGSHLPGDSPSPLPR